MGSVSVINVLRTLNILKDLYECLWPWKICGMCHHMISHNGPTIHRLFCWTKINIFGHLPFFLFAVNCVSNVSVSVSIKAFITSRCLMCDFVDGFIRDKAQVPSHAGANVPELAAQPCFSNCAHALSHTRTYTHFPSTSSSLLLIPHKSMLSNCILSMSSSACLLLVLPSSFHPTFFLPPPSPSLCLFLSRTLCFTHIYQDWRVSTSRCMHSASQVTGLWCACEIKRWKVHCHIFHATMDCFVRV